MATVNTWGSPTGRGSPVFHSKLASVTQHAVLQVHKVKVQGQAYTFVNPPIFI